MTLDVQTELEALTHQAKQTEQLAVLAAIKNLPGTLAALKGWSVKRGSALVTWLCPGCDRQGCHSAATIKPWQRLCDHCRSLDRYPDALPYGVLLTIQDALSYGLNRDQFLVCDPQYLTKGDPLLLYWLDPPNWPGAELDHFIVLAEWNKVMEA